MFVTIGHVHKTVNEICNIRCIYYFLNNSVFYEIKMSKIYLVLMDCVLPLVPLTGTAWIAFHSYFQYASTHFDVKLRN